jgi:hypothetical protein
MRRKAKKLQLSKETIQLLDEHQITAVVGGGTAGICPPTVVTDCSPCPSDTCRLC